MHVRTPCIASPTFALSSLYPPILCDGASSTSEVVLPADKIGWVISPIERTRFETIRSSGYPVAADLTAVSDPSSFGGVLASYSARLHVRLAQRLAAAAVPHRTGSIHTGSGTANARHQNMRLRPRPFSPISAISTGKPVWCCCSLCEGRAVTTGHSPLVGGRSRDRHIVHTECERAHQVPTFTTRAGRPDRQRAPLLPRGCSQSAAVWSGRYRQSTGRSPGTR